MHTGHVTAFDDDAGLGTIAGDDGVVYPFQCIAIADGTRAIEVDRRVGFCELPRFGQIEAGQITKF